MVKALKEEQCAPEPQTTGRGEQGKRRRRVKGGKTGFVSSTKKEKKR